MCLDSLNLLKMSRCLAEKFKFKSADTLLLFSCVAPVLPFLNASVHVPTFYAYIRPYILLRSK